MFMHFYNNRKEYRRTKKKLTGRSTQSRITYAGVFIVAKVKESGPIITVQIDTLIHHSFYNVYMMREQPTRL